MFSTAFILYGIFILGYGIFTAALVYHVYTFAIPEDPLHTFVIPFILISLILVGVSFYFFLHVPWNTIL
ncbi:MAG: hypothetical protein A3J54_04405 [Candidatus Ryanbacteria bacterium RIFCSPHIGHO2_02_FULL_45_13b]|uniref:Uncharacterized protein n=1 Tax=Candidatus Ryanbacteria bacterium RIFCSPHIGHO2_02_FULL_45_13b TaxID=1802117 RepID=A0A1G2G4D5_9BACT|nr:MAG: hypothetical protein A3J54_04405 [Candidatus Ryanbacteria bacterium RIFCSPHIGHO2_02_FULL_45_13b]